MNPTVDIENKARRVHVTAGAWFMIWIVGGQLITQVYNIIAQTVQARCVIRTVAAVFENLFPRKHEVQNALRSSYLHILLPRGADNNNYTREIIFYRPTVHIGTCVQYRECFFFLYINCFVLICATLPLYSNNIVDNNKFYFFSTLAAKFDDIKKKINNSYKHERFT